MENNSKSKATRSERKSKKRIIIRSKSQTVCKENWADYALIINFLQIELFIVEKN